MQLTIDRLKELIPHTHTDGENLYGTCPWCNHSEFGISLKDNHQFGCFRKSKCGKTGNIYTLLRFLGISIEKHEVETPLGSLRATLPSLYQDEQEQESQLVEISMPVGYKRIYHHDYLAGRNFTEYEQYEVGITNIETALKGYVIFRIQQNGQTVAYVGRNTLKNSKPKYNNSTSAFGSILHGCDEIDSHTHTILLVEGLMDKISIDRFLKKYKITDIKCCNTFGAKFSINQSKLIVDSDKKNLIFMHELDVKHQTLKYATKIAHKFNSVKIASLPQEKDPDTMTESQIMDCIEQSTSILSLNTQL